MLSYSRYLSPVTKSSLLHLNIKTVTLILILKGQRDQSLHLLRVRNIKICRGNIFGDTLKTSRPGYQQVKITVKAYAPDRRLCLMAVLKEILEEN